MKHYFMIFIAMLLLVCTGCMKELDLFPKDTVSDATFWRSSEDFQAAANNLYFSLVHGAWNSGEIYRRDWQSDIAFRNPNSISNGTQIVPETDGQWDQRWVYIRRANMIIDRGTNSPPQVDIKRWVAEAKFFRALNYWELFRLYGGVPIVDKVLDLNSEALYGSRAGRKETVDFILKDLTDAAPDLPLQSQLSNAEFGRITRGTAEALKARVALFEGTWGKFRSDPNANSYLDMAIAASQSVINSKQYSLYTGMGDKSYRYLFIEHGDDSPESILDYRIDINLRFNVIPEYLNINCMAPTKNLVDLYLCDDGLPISQSPRFQGYGTFVSEYQNRDPRMTMTLLVPGTPIIRFLAHAAPMQTWPFFPQAIWDTGYTLYKYSSEDSNSALNRRWGYDLRLIRYAEVLMMYAEAKFERNGSITDADLDISINLLRDRVNMIRLSNSHVANNGLDMRNEIRRERTIELAMEGFRRDDLLRWKTAETVLPDAIRGIKIVGTQWQTDPVIISNVDRNVYKTSAYQNRVDSEGFILTEKAENRFFDANKDYLRPLPAKQIFLNPNLQQNPGW